MAVRYTSVFITGPCHLLCLLHQHCRVSFLSSESSNSSVGVFPKLLPQSCKCTKKAHKSRIVWYPWVTHFIYSNTIENDVKWMKNTAWIFKGIVYLKTSMLSSANLLLNVASYSPYGRGWYHFSHLSHCNKVRYDSWNVKLLLSFYRWTEKGCRNQVSNVLLNIDAGIWGNTHPTVIIQQ